MSAQLAHLYITFCIARALFHAALLMGLPLAHWAPGGGPEGRLAAGARFQCGLAAVVFTLQGGAMLIAARFPGLSDIAWLPDPFWAGCVAVALPGLGALLAWFSKSDVDRRLWLPLDCVLMALSLAALSV